MIEHFCFGKKNVKFVDYSVAVARSIQQLEVSICSKMSIICLYNNTIVVFQVCLFSRAASLLTIRDQCGNGGSDMRMVRALVSF